MTQKRVSSQQICVLCGDDVERDSVMYFNYEPYTGPVCKACYDETETRRMNKSIGYRKKKEVRGNPLSEDKRKNVEMGKKTKKITEKDLDVLKHMYNLKDHPEFHGRMCAATPGSVSRFHKLERLGLVKYVGRYPVHSDDYDPCTMTEGFEYQTFELTAEGMGLIDTKY